MVEKDFETLKNFYEMIESMQKTLLWMPCSQERDDDELMRARFDLGKAKIRIDNVIKENSFKSGV